MELSQIKEYLNYDSSTGVFTWIKKPNGKITLGSQAGSKDKEGYTQIQFGGKTYRANRLAWFFTYGVFPEKQIDHIDRDKSNDRLFNLREVTARENQHNSDFFKGGVSYHKRDKLWIARTRVGSNNRKVLGYFKTEQEAKNRYIEEVING